MRPKQCGTGMDMYRALADGVIGEGDYEEIERFGAFLTESGPRPGNEGYDKDRYWSAYKKHYPEDWAEMMARLKESEVEREHRAE